MAECVTVDLRPQLVEAQLAINRSWGGPDRAAELL
jgi:hypothetical protein